MKRRILPLLLALCLLSSPARAVTTPAHFLDWPLVREKAAVTMLSDIGLISGYDDGTFQPARLVTRAEAAKLIASLLADDPFSVSPCRFPDAAAGWASGYVEFCAEKGVISGDPGTPFRPDDEVTVRERAKMLLVVLGYRADSYTGPAWAANVDRDAVTAGLYTGFTGTASESASRETACLLINNALQSSVVTGFDETGAPRYALDEMLQPRSLLEIRFQITPVSGVVQANELGDLRPGGEGVEPYCFHLGGFVRDFCLSSQYAQDNALLGHLVTVYARFGDDYNQVFGIPAIRATEISYTASDRKTLQNLMDYAELELTAETKYYEDYRAADAACLDRLDTGGSVSVIDHNADKAVDIVLVRSAES